MITSLGKHALAAAAVFAAGGIGALAAQAPAQAGGVNTAFTCSGPQLGTRTTVLDGWLASPGETAVGRPTAIRLHIARLHLASPRPIVSWTASARINVSGTESTWFRVTGAGGFTHSHQPLSGDLTGELVPAVRGPHLLSVGGITVNANTAGPGGFMVHCVPNDRPVVETLRVFPAFETGWAGPGAPRPGWHRPVLLPPYHHGEWEHHQGGDRPLPLPLPLPHPQH